jgi:hypothetical protein
LNPIESHSTTVKSPWWSLNPKDLQIMLNPMLNPLIPC